jgi:hypothetical protein
MLFVIALQQLPRFPEILRYFDLQARNDVRHNQII